MLPLTLHPTEHRLPLHEVEFLFHRLAADRLLLRFKLAKGGSVELRPLSEKPERRDELWKQSCFECFMVNAAHRGPNAHYMEWNLSPSGDWQAYWFSGYRQGRVDATLAPELAAPRSSRRQEGDSLIFEFQIPIPVQLQNVGFEMGVSAVMQDSTMPGAEPFYWAFAHREEKPDFHSRQAMLVIVPDFREPELRA